MTTSVEPETASPQPDQGRAQRLPKLVRWAARLTSIPIFAMLMISLVPALSNFAISAKDDKLIALCMCGTALGFISAWRWPGIGGSLAALSVGVILVQADGSIFADPFSLAFGTQAILFLISSVLNSTSSQTTGARFVWLKRAAVGLLVVSAAAAAIFIYRGPGPTPLSKQKEAFVGVWENGSGFTLEINADGRATVSQDKAAKVESCNTPFASGGRGDFQINFPTDDKLELTRGPLESSKLYHIDRRPFPHNKDIRMILNGSDPYARSHGMLLVKNQTARPNPDKLVSGKKP